MFYTTILEGSPLFQKDQFVFFSFMFNIIWKMEVLIDPLEIFYLFLHWVQIAHALVCFSKVLIVRHTENHSSFLHLCWSSPNCLHLVDICSFLKIQAQPHLLQEAYHLCDFGQVAESS